MPFIIGTQGRIGGKMDLISQLGEQKNNNIAENLEMFGGGLGLRLDFLFIIL